jgi:hypothetical protein
MIGQWLKTAKAAAKPGTCIFCAVPLPESKSYVAREICRKLRCRREYRKLWRRDNRESGLRTVVKRMKSPTHPGVRIEILECGHILEQTDHRRMKRRHCAMCKTARPG